MNIELIKSSLLHKVAPLNGIQAEAYPTLILLHGRGTSEDDLLGLLPFLDERFFVISARAPFEFPFGGYTWYEILEAGSPDPRQFAESYDRLSAFIDGVKKGYPVDADRLFLLGFSMGSVMSLALALTKPNVVKGVVAHSGYIPENTPLKFDWNHLSATSFFVAHGTLDPIIPVDFGRRAKTLLSAAHADLTYHEYSIGHQISEESLNDLSLWLQTKLDVLNVAKG